MKNLAKLTGSTNTVQNLIALTGLVFITSLIITFTVLAITSGIKPF